MIESLNNEKDIKSEVEIHDRAASLGNFSFSLGNILGSFFGGIYIDNFGFTRAMTFQGVFILAYVLIFVWRKKDV